MNENLLSSGDDNDDPRLVSRKSAKYHGALGEMAMLESARLINEGLQSIREGRVRDFSEFESEMRIRLDPDGKE